MTTITTRARAFSAHGVETIVASVDCDGTVRVWDTVARHYTTCHSLTTSAVRRIRRLANAADEVRCGARPASEVRRGSSVG